MSERRNEVLRQAFEEIKRLRREVPQIHIVANGDLEFPETYEIEMEIQSYTQIQESGRYKAKPYPAFRFQIELPINYPHEPAKCIAFPPIPFHPHFKIQRHTIRPEQLSQIFQKYGIWVDYKEFARETLGMFILRIAHSLNYEQNYIGEEFLSDIGNIDALRWYNNVRLRNPELFPTDAIQLPVQLSRFGSYAITTQTVTKKFEISSEHDENNETVSPLRFIPHRKTFTIENSLNESSMSELERGERKKFEIVQLSNSYQPEEKNIPNFHIVPILTSNYADDCDDSHVLYISEFAQRQILGHVKWGESSETNQVEQGGILIGQSYLDREKRIIYGLVEKVIHGRLAKGFRTRLEIDHNAWKEMVDQADEMLDIYPEKNLQIIGWYHTHPNDLQVFMSETDMATQGRMFKEDWQFAIVINPHRKVWRAFYGKDAKECKGFFIESNEQEQALRG